MYTEASSPRKPGERARLMSEVLPVTASSMCLSFWYHMHGSGMGTLTVYKQPASSGILQNMFQISSEQGNAWKQAFVTIAPGAQQYMLIFEGVIGPSYASDIAIDDILYTQGACTANSSAAAMFSCHGRGQRIASNKVCNFFPDCSDGSDETNCGNCTFESGLCNYMDTSSGSFRFVRVNNATFDGSLSLPADHTRNRSSGNVLFVDSSQGSANAQASLQSPTLRKSAPGCMLSFYYYVIGRGGGTVQVSIHTGSTTSLVWSSSSLRSSGRWVRGLANIGAYDGDFNVIVQARRFYSYGSVAIDDIQLLGCSFPPAQPQCSASQFRCPAGFCIHKYQVCDFDQDCGAGDNNDESNCTAAHMCNFEQSLCDWSQDQGDDLDWSRKHGPTSSAHTGPSRDHTTGLTSGYYLYTESSGAQRYGKKARLLSPVIQAASPSDNCYISMYFFMFGDTMGTLNVYTRTVVNGYMSTILSRSGDLGQVWVKYATSLVVSQPFQVVIESVIGQGYRSDLAIDDLVLSAGCQYSGTTLPPAGYMTTTASTRPNTCGTSMFQCSDGSCIDQVRFCDFTVDCRDGSDEATCGSCNFESGMCGYRDMSVGRYNWTRSYPAVMGVTGPAQDHTFRNGTGHYAYVEGTRGVFRQAARLQSPPLPAFSRYCIMYFYYFVAGPQAGTLEVGITGNSTYQRLYTTPHYARSTVWRSGFVYLGRATNGTGAGSRLEFRVMPALSQLANNTADIAIDDILFRNCNPRQFPPDVSCNFDNGLCSWVQSQNDQFDWSLSNSTTGTRGTGPSSDHTRPGRGSYAYIEASAPQRRGDIAMLTTPWLSPTDSTGYCLTFYYHMFGSQIGNLTLSLVTPTTMQTFWSVQGPHGDQWRQASRTIVSNEEYTLYFQASVGGYQGDIAIDDILTRRGACPPKPLCDFEENGLCDWVRGPSSNVNWTLGSNGVVSRGTGPSIDHTFGSNTGHFLFVNPNGANPGDRAVIINTPQYATSYVYGCLQFWYYMAGPNTGSLNVSVLPNSTSPVSVWSMQGNQGNMWRHATIRLPTIRTRGFSIIVGATRGNGIQGNIALDDVSYARRTCPALGYCNFETDTCGYINVQGDDTNWQRDRGASSSFTTGPTTDHTRRSPAGYYMYMETSTRHQPGDKAWLFSETLPAPRTSAGACIIFYFHMYGEGIGTLNVYTKATSSQNKTLIWTVSGDQGNIWRQAQAQVSVNETYEVIFEGVLGGNNTGDIAIDDIVASITQCRGLTTTVTTPTVVTSPATYPHTSIDCDFESATCNWQQDTNDQLDWNLQSGETPTAATGPSADHTFGTLQGHYAYMEVTSTTANSSARLISPPYSVGATGVCFKFWYYMFGSSVNRLNLWTRSGPNNQTSLVCGTLSLSFVLSVSLSCKTHSNQRSVKHTPIIVDK